MIALLSNRRSDVFLAKDEGQYVCGWHVDDWGFWPATASSTGVNAWVAIDDMPVSTGGGFALSVGSHQASWRYTAYEITGATPTLPLEGFKSAKDMFTNRKGSGTCNLRSADPQLNEIIEDSARIYDIKAGDVIFHTRWLFHRTVPFNIKETKALDKIHPTIYRRYSVRYAPGTAQLPRGYGTELR